MRNFNKELQAKKTALVGENIKLLGDSIKIMALKKYEDLAGLQVRITANTTELLKIDEQLKQQQNG